MRVPQKQPTQNPAESAWSAYSPQNPQRTPQSSDKESCKKLWYSEVRAWGIRKYEWSLCLILRFLYTSIAVHIGGLQAPLCIYIYIHVYVNLLCSEAGLIVGFSASLWAFMLWHVGMLTMVVISFVLSLAELLRRLVACY